MEFEGALGLLLPAHSNQDKVTSNAINAEDGGTVGENVLLRET